MNPHILRASLLQLSGIIGVGIFGLPFIFHASNLYVALLLFIPLLLATLYINSSYVDIILATPGDHQLSGYTKKYLGSFASKLMLLNTLILSMGASLAFVQFGGTFISVLIPFIPSTYASLWFVIIIILLYTQKNRLWHTMFDFLPLLFLLIPLLLLVISQTIPTSQLSPPSSSLLFVGWAMFALSGFTVIPEVEEILRDAGLRQYTKHASSMGTLLAWAIYVIFILAVTKISGPYLTWDTVTGLLKTHPFAAKIVAVLGILTTLKGTINFLLVCKETLYRDVKVPRSVAENAVLLVPVCGLLLLSVPSSTWIRPFVTVSVGISVTLLLLIHLKLKPSLAHKIATITTFILFLCATIAEL